MPTMAPDNSTPDGTKLSAPKRIIRSVCSYSARTNKELSFDKGEFFHVVDHEDDPRWYDACNPLTGKRGLVPVSHFEIMESRQERIRRIQRSSSSVSASQVAAAPTTATPTATSTANIGTSSSSSSSASSSSASSEQQQSGSLSSPVRASLGISRSASNVVLAQSSPRMDSNGHINQRRPSEGGLTLVESMSGMSLRSRAPSFHHQRKLSQQGLGFPSTPQPSAMQLYGTVLYDFEAENSDETTVRADEPVLVVAQSTADWFVVKPAMRAAAPGLVPVSYIRLRDHVTGGPVDDLQAYLSRYHVRLPSVAEWKKKSLASRSTHSSVSANSDATTTATAGNANSGANRNSGSNSSPASSTFEDRAPTPVSGLGSLVSGQSATSKMKPRNRARTASSSTSSIAERSSFRPFHKGRQASISSLQHLSSDNFPPFHPAELLSVGVPSFICKDGAYLFLVSLKFKSGDERNLYRGYDDFIHFQIQLSDSFPEETASLKSSRFLTHSSNMGYLNDSIAERRRSDIDEYIQNVLALPQNVVVSPVFQSLFGSSVGFHHHHHQHALTQQHQQPLYRSLSTMLHTTLPPTYPTQHASTPSTDSGVDTSSTPVSTSSSRTMVEEPLSVDANGNSAMSMPKTIEGVESGELLSSGNKALALEPVRPPPRIVHKSSTLALAGSISMIKAKLKLGADMVALRLPSTASVNELKSRIAEKLESEFFATPQDEISQIMYFAPSGESAPLSADEDWATALQVTNNKPVLTIVR